MAEWVRQIRGQNGQDRQDGQVGQSIESISSIPSTKSIPPTKSISSKRSTYPETAANAALVLIGVAVALLDRQIAAQADAFENEGGFTERLYRTRRSRRGGG